MLKIGEKLRKPQGHLHNMYPPYLLGPPGVKRKTYEGKYILYS